MHTEFLRQSSGEHHASCLGPAIFAMAAAATQESAPRP